MTNQKDSAEKRGKLTMIALVVMAVALVVCIALLVFGAGGRQQAETAVESSSATALERGFVDENNAEEIISEMSDKVAEGMFECRMTTEWTFQDGTSESPNAYVANAETNRNTLYFDVYEKSSNEVIYSSPMIPVGSSISSIKLEKALPAGEYDAVVMYTLVDEDYKEVSTVGFNITISVNH